MNLSGKVAIVTGASRGIGRAIAVELSKSGASVIINYSKDLEGAEETLKQIIALGGYGLVRQWDVSDFKSCISAVEYIYNHFGKIDILINNAGISNIGLFIDMNEDTWNEMIDVNIKGTFNMSHAVLNYMLKNKKGTIINISSIWGITGASCESIYSATKGAINSFTKALAREMGPSGIRVNAIAPGVIETEMNKWLSDEEKVEIVENIPLGNIGSPNDIANISAFLCSDEAKYLTGQIITVDGGYI